MAWLELMVCAWTALTVQSLQLTPRYSELGHNESLVSNCGRRQCQVAYWCRMRRGSEFQFLLSTNTAGKGPYGPGLSLEKYTGSVQVGSTTSSFTLKIRQVDKRDTGLYFSILKDQSSFYLGTPVTLLKPGEEPPTSPPTTASTTTKRAKAPRSCSCPDTAKTKPVKGCDLTVWASLGGTLLSLSLVLLVTLLYFSRLPKKCHHRFRK